MMKMFSKVCEENYNLDISDDAVSCVRFMFDIVFFEERAPVSLEALMVKLYLQA